MWHHVGITRCPDQLEMARHEIQRLRRRAEAAFSSERARRDIIELRNLAQVGELMIQSAQDRRESLGSHYWTQCQTSSDRPPTDTVLRP
jgi:L-aspartate oxidase